MNPLKAALDSKLGRKLRGVSIVDNAADPYSAYSRRRNAAQSSRALPASVPNMTQQNIDNTYKKTKVFGTPYAK